MHNIDFGLYSSKKASACKECSKGACSQGISFTAAVLHQGSRSAPAAKRGKKLMVRGREYIGDGI
jgi:hypothetical protein